jgi:hypothetical protein
MSKLSIYCGDCGARIIYAAKKPNFCEKCGNSLNPASQGTQKVETSEEEIDGPAFPSIDKLEVETQLYANNSVRMEDLIESQRLSPNAPMGGGSAEAAEYREPHNLSSDQIMEEFRREAGTRGRGGE